MANKNYKSLFENLERRMNPDKIVIEKAFTEELSRTPYNYEIQYIKKAMRGVEPEYTKNTIAAGKRVRDTLENNLKDVSFEFQGSVMTNTHLRGYSDIDLLVICEKFFTFDKDGIDKILNQSDIFFKYSPNQINRLNEAVNGGGYMSAWSDLRKLRSDSEIILRNSYQNLDLTRSKSIKVNTDSPKREVDVVIASWYQNAKYYIFEDLNYRGIQIFEKGTEPWLDKKLPPDYPFLSIKRINEKDGKLFGRLKKMIRFIKTVKMDSGREIELSSFDINAICYDIETSKYFDKDYIELVSVVYNQLQKLNDDFSYRFNLKSVDEEEYIFRNDDKITENREKTDSLKILLNELRLIISDVISESRLIA